MYENAMQILNTPNSDRAEAFSMLVQAAARKHKRARAELAWAHTLGRYANIDLPFAVKAFDELVKDGLPEAHMVSGFCFALLKVKMMC